MHQILLAEDDAILGRLVKEALEIQSGFSVRWKLNGKEALDAFKEAAPDLCIIDVMMPLMDGFALARSIRILDNAMPIIFLTARTKTEDVVKGFEAGGNDYLKKPFSVEELILRVRELLRRAGSNSVYQTAGSESFTLGRYQFNAATQTLQCPEASCQLSGKEAALLKELILHKNKLLQRKPVLIKLWGDDNFFNARNMDVYIAKLRKYLVYDPAISIINIRGHGFKLIEH